eukprot:Gb_23253 [translate_table: standard]
MSSSTRAQRFLTLRAVFRLGLLASNQERDQTSSILSLEVLLRFPQRYSSEVTPPASFKSRYQHTTMSRYQHATKTGFLTPEPVWLSHTKNANFQRNLLHTRFVHQQNVLEFFSAPRVRFHRTTSEFSNFESPNLTLESSNPSPNLRTTVFFSTRFFYPRLL